MGNCVCPCDLTGIQDVRHRYEEIAILGGGGSHCAVCTVATDGTGREQSDGSKPFGPIFWTGERKVT